MSFLPLESTMDIQSPLPLDDLPLPWPWEDTDGLAPVLVKTGLWADIFDNPRLRKSIKVEAKRLAPATHRMLRGRCTTDEIFDTFAADLARQISGRKAIAKAYRKCFVELRFCPDVANRLYQISIALAGESPVCSLPDLEETAEQRGGKSFIVPARLGQWLRANSWGESDREPLALFCCAFAILQAEEAREILRQALEADERLRPYFYASESEEVDSAYADDESARSLPLAEGSAPDQESAEADCSDGNDSSRRIVQDSIVASNPETGVESGTEFGSVLERRFGEVVLELRDAADNLEHFGRLPDPALEERLTALRKEFGAAAARAQTALQEAGLLIEPQTPLQTLAQLRDVHSRIESERRRQLVDERTAILNTADRVRCEADLKLASAVHAASAELRSALEDGDSACSTPTWRALHSLVLMVQKPDNLDDSDWDAGVESVEAVFGQAMARAVVRRRFSIDLDPKGTGSDDEELTGAPADELSDDGTNARTQRPAPNAEVSERTSTDTQASDVCGLESKPEIGPPHVETFLELGGSTDPAVTEEPVVHPSEIEADPTQGRLEVVEDSGVSAPVPSNAPTPVSPDETIVALAVAVQQSDESNYTSRAQNLALGLMRDSELSRAYHLLRSVEATQSRLPQRDVMIPSDLALALLLGPHVRRAVDDAAMAIAECFKRLLTEAQTDSMLRDTDAGRILTMSACMRPALVAPGCFAADVLRAIPAVDGFQPLNNLQRAVYDFASHGHTMSLQALTGIAEHEEWATRLETVRREALDWLERNRQSTILYAPTTNVWHRFLDQKEPLGGAFEMVANDERQGLQRIHEVIDEWSASDYVRDQVRSYDQRIRKRKAALRPIEARALQAVEKKAKEAIAHLQAWREVASVEPERFNTFTISEVRQYRERILSALSGVETELRERLQNAAGLPVSTSLHCLGRAVSDLRAMFDSTSSDPSSETLDIVVNEDLLLASGVSLGDDWTPSADSINLMAMAIADSVALMRDWESAFDLHCDQDNYDSAAKVIDRLELSGASVEEVERMRRTLTVRHRESVLTLQNERETLVSRMRRMVFEGILAQSDEQEYDARIGDIPGEVPSDLRPLRTVLQQFADRLEVAQREHTQKLKSRIAEMQLQTASPKIYDRVSVAISDGDLRAAEEMLVRAEHGEDLPPLERPALPVFLPDFVEAMEREYPKAPPISPDVARAVREGRFVGPLNLSTLPPAQARHAAEALSAWESLRRKPSNLPTGKLEQLFREIGFDVESCIVERPPSSNPYAWAELKAQPILDGLVCPVPRFGSEAQGRYRVLLLWGKPVEADILKIAFARPGDLPVVVLYMGQMPARRRRDLAHRCRKERRSVLILDEFLFLYLMQFGARLHRLSAFFKTSLFFTVADPYTTTAGFVPPEMFFGREHEARQVVDRNNVHLVYGGRQLGKTALLRHVERLENDPAAGRIVRWVDLTNAHGIGLNRPISDIWQVIAQTVRSDGVGTEKLTAPDSITRAIKTWLDADETRRVVLLLDEADLFLEADASALGQDNRPAPWVHTRSLKALSDETERRFKFVFAGLHNVQRSARDPNSPIAHLGEAVCIGPFLSTSDLRDAHEMTLRPFEALGYRFESQDLVMSIMSYTNYYPSLIQLFCKHLLDHVSGPAASFDGETPPYVITSRHIEDTYQSRSLHSAIVERFNWTLDLDPRYRVIALLLAVAIHEDRSLLSTGFSAAHVREECLRWWHTGFANDPSLEGVETLLDEMVGLGVLRMIDERRFTLRSPNVVRMLGNEDQLLAALDQVSREEPRVQYDPTIFRREHASDRWRRSPLTARQESTLCGTMGDFRLAVLYGAKAAGGESVAEALDLLRSEREDLAVSVCDTPTSGSQLIDAVDTQWRKKQEGTLVVIVPSSVSWDCTWLAEAQRWLGARRRGSRRSASIVFQSTLESAEKLNDMRCKRPLTSWTELSLGPWHANALRRWLDRIGIPDNSDSREKILAVTGGWHKLVEELGQRCAHDSHEWVAHLDSLEQSMTTDRKWFEAFGLTPLASRVLHVHADVGGEPLTVRDMLDFDPTLGTLSTIEATLDAADRLRYVHRESEDRWRFDSLLLRLAPHWIGKE
jgi:hypothetical protein